MTKKNYIELIKELVCEEPSLFRNDIPAINMLFNKTKDSLHKDGDITDNQVQNWILTYIELRSILHLLKKVTKMYDIYDDGRMSTSDQEKEIRLMIDS